VIPLPQLAVEFVLGLGAALFAGNAWALLRPKVVRWRTGKITPSPPRPNRVMLNMAIGLVAAAWAAATLISRA
jgi:hypothetical protein